MTEGSGKGERLRLRLKPRLKGSKQVDMLLKAPLGFGDNNLEKESKKFFGNSSPVPKASLWGSSLYSSEKKGFRARSYRLPAASRGLDNLRLKK